MTPAESRKLARHARASSGYSTLRVSRATLAALRALLNLRRDVYGADELLAELVAAELQRRRALRVAS